VVSKSTAAKAVPVAAPAMSTGLLLAGAGLAVYFVVNKLVDVVPDAVGYLGEKVAGGAEALGEGTGDFFGGFLGGAEDDASLATIVGDQTRATLSPFDSPDFIKDSWLGRVDIDAALWKGINPFDSPDFIKDSPLGRVDIDAALWKGINPFDSPDFIKDSPLGVLDIDDVLIENCY